MLQEEEAEAAEYEREQAKKAPVTKPKPHPFDGRLGKPCRLDDPPPPNPYLADRVIVTRDGPDTIGPTPVLTEKEKEQAAEAEERRRHTMEWIRNGPEKDEMPHSMNGRPLPPLPPGQAPVR